MPSKSSPLTIVAAFAAVTIAGGGLLFAQHLARPTTKPKPVATTNASASGSAATTANRPPSRDLGQFPPPMPRTTTMAVAESDEPSAKIWRQSVAASDEPTAESVAPAQTERVLPAEPQAARGVSPFAAETERLVDAPPATAAPVETAAPLPPPRPPSTPWWDYRAAPIFVPVENGNPLGTPGTSTVGTAGTSTLGTSGTRTLGTSGTSTLGTAGTSTVGTNTTRAITPQSPR